MGSFKVVETDGDLKYTILYYEISPGVEFKERTVLRLSINHLVAVCSWPNHMHNLYVNKYLFCFCGFCQRINYKFMTRYTHNALSLSLSLCEL